MEVKSEAIQAIGDTIVIGTKGSSLKLLKKDQNEWKIENTIDFPNLYFHFHHFRLSTEGDFLFASLKKRNFLMRFKVDC